MHQITFVDGRIAQNRIKIIMEYSTISIVQLKAHSENMFVFFCVHHHSVIKIIRTISKWKVLSTINCFWKISSIRHWRIKKSMSLHSIYNACMHTQMLSLQMFKWPSNHTMEKSVTVFIWNNKWAVLNRCEMNERPKFPYYAIYGNYENYDA